LYSMNSKGPDTNFSKPLSNDFNRLGEKWANRRLLLYLIEHHDQVVTKEDLHVHLWPDQFVSDSALTYYISGARRAVGDSGRSQRVIKTIYGRGYSFVAPLETAAAPGSTAPETPVDTEPPEAAIEPAGFHPNPPLQGRRQVTVLWGHIVATSASPTLLDPEERYEIIRHVQTACGDVLRQFDGYLDQYLSHGFFGYFGFPQAHEDDALRAVRAGLEMIRRVPRLSQDIAPRGQIDLALRIGIHTGVVVMDTSRRDDDLKPLILGDVPHIATELARLGDPHTMSNAIIVSATTFRLIEGYFVCQSLGDYFLDALAESVVAHQVLRASGAQSRIEAALATRLTPFVGRQQEIGLLQARWEQAIIGMGQLVLLSGDAGMGKSRLVHAWSEQLTGAIHTRIECRCSSYTQHSMLYPILDQLQHVMQFERDDTPEDKGYKLEAWLDRLDLSREEFMPLLARWFSLTLPEGYAPSALSPQQQKQKMFEALLVWLLSEAEAQPVCFVMEDLHWADPSTLDWLNFLLGHIPTSRMLLLFTFRPDFHPPWPPSDYIAQLTLNRLSPPQVDAMIDEVTDGKALPAEIRQQLTTQTDGVPLFVEEMTRMVLESGLVKERDGRYELADTPQRLAIPSTLHDALIARLDQLETGKHTVQLAATIGREFSYDLIRAVTRLDDIMLQQDLVQLVDATLLYQRGLPPRAQYHFKHALIQEAAYQSLLRSTRRQYHQDIGQVLEEQFPETCDSQPELLAYHYTEAGLPARSVVYWQHAARQAFERAAFLDAEAHVQQGLLAVAELPDSSERDPYELALQTLLAAILRFTKSYGAPEVIDALRRAHDLCEQVGGMPQRFSVLRSLWLSYIAQSQLATAYEFGERLLELAQQQQDAALILEAHRDIGTSLLFLGEQITASQHFAQGHQYNKKQSSPALTILHGQGTEEPILLGYQAWNLWLRGYPDQALLTMNQALNLVQSHDSMQNFTLSSAQYFTLLSSAILHQWRRELDDVHLKVEASLVLLDQEGSLLHRARGITLQGWVLAQRGQREEGIALIRRGIADYRVQGVDLTSTFMLAMLAEIYGQTGESEAGLDVLTEALGLAHTYDERWWEADLYRLQAELLLQWDKHDRSEAEATLQQALTVAREQGARSLELRAAISLGRLWYGQGKRHQARLLVDDIYSWFTEGHDTADLKDAQSFLSV